MPFPLFPKSPGKGKPLEASLKPKSAAAPEAVRQVSARELAAAVKGRPAAESPREPVETHDRDITVTGPPSLIEWTPRGRSIFEVVEVNPGLSAVLENAALLYANDHATQARALLEDGVANDPDTKISPLAWLALFDLLQRAGDRATFDQLALQYVVAFERSAPAWDEQAVQHSRPGARSAGAVASGGGYIGLTGKLTGANAQQIANMLGAAQKQPKLRLDLGSLTGADAIGAKLLSDALAQLRKRRYPLTIQHPERLRQGLDKMVVQGRSAGEGYWTLLLELLQWQNDRKVFEDRAVDFAVAFELSPPSWEPPPVAAETPPVAAAAPGTSTEPPGSDPDATTADAEMLVWHGTMTGSTDPQLAKFALFREGRQVVPVDMSAVDRVDFVCAGALLNAINKAETQRKTVQLVGATPIIRALLLLLGISPRHFIRKAL